MRSKYRSIQKAVQLHLWWSLLAGDPLTRSEPEHRLQAGSTILNLILFLALLACPSGAAESLRSEWKFSFRAGTPALDTVAVTASDVFTIERGYGFDGGTIPTPEAKPFYFSAAVPEGNYRVTVTFGDVKAASDNTVKAELRRLMLEKVTTAPGQFVTRSFTVNVRTPQIAAVGNIAAGVVKLKAPRETTQEAWAWDRCLTLEFNGTHPAVAAIEITPVEVPVLFLLGDSTVTDQSREPYNSWGQMLTHWFKPGIAVANHGESGETYRDSLGRRRLDKVLSVMKPGDTLLMQFGHNDQKQIAQGSGGPFTTYKAEIKAHVEAVRSRGGIPIIVSPMERRGFDEHGKVVPSLADYAEAARQSAQELGTAFIDLNAMSKTLYEALGEERTKSAFALTAPGKLDNTHHCNYGSYELAKCVLLGLQSTKADVVRFISDDFKGFDPAHPDPIETFAVPPSPLYTNERPLGDVPLK